MGPLRALRSHGPDVYRLGTAVEVEEHLASGRQVPGQVPEALPGVVEVVEDPEARYEVEAPRGEQGQAQVGPDHAHVVESGQVARRGLYRCGAIEGDHRLQVPGQHAGEATLPAPGVETDASGQAGQVEVLEVDGGE
jgi:hypothetical protein